MVGRDAQPPFTFQIILLQWETCMAQCQNCHITKLDRWEYASSSSKLAECLLRNVLLSAQTALLQTHNCRLLRRHSAQQFLLAIVSQFQLVCK